MGSKKLLLGINPIEDTEEEEVNPDWLAPEKIVNLTTERSPRSITLIWEWSGDTINFKEFVIYLSGITIPNTNLKDYTVTKFVLIDLEPNTLYSIKIVVAGKNGKDSKPTSVSIRTPRE